MADPQPPPDEGGGGHDEALWGNIRDLDIEGTISISGKPGEGWAGEGRGVSQATQIGPPLLRLARTPHH